MARVNSSGSDLDLDIDLESGETTSDEDLHKDNVMSGQDAKNTTGRMKSENLIVESSYRSTNCSGSSYDNLLNSEEISANSEETQCGRFRDNKTSDKEKSKKKNPAKPPKPPRPPRGPSLDASDMKLLKEISELNVKRKRMERIRTLKKMKKEKASSSISNLFALLVTVIFLLVIVFQDWRFKESDGLEFLNRAIISVASSLLPLPCFTHVYGWFVIDSVYGSMVIGIANPSYSLQG
ncbi:hypothetical protein F511_42206 [Dorcoceras hygrometricum]|uniref:Uncharacterized protein n=1 Tax=Dorcoceras hygrometricum TaxID=472368 RepID=A0A2Z6ZZH0_9LAMI|nr:hypothetical protein F511_42206 [Dorcoceras hygrometricum]